MPPKTIMLTLFVLTLAGCGRIDNNWKLKAKIKEITIKADQAKNPVYKFRLDSLTDFPWNEAYFFSGNSGGIGLDYISKNIGAQWDGPDLDDGELRLIFVNDHVVVSYVDFDLNDRIWFLSCDSSPQIDQNYFTHIKKNTSNQFITYLHCDSTNKIRMFVPKHCSEIFKDRTDCK
ncbi:hypothetical protein NF867_07150 [Solitalea sp. MAHUQ-68]|uniref:Lipoprotein n=2 Tax=Sphingobacteriaceae TaxID=84566 RepID=A0A9X2F0Z3_9SPHI|nr:hypothetical protein [Solitalea agri]